MNVRSLIEILSKYDKDSQVVINNIFIDYNLDNVYKEITTNLDFTYNDKINNQVILESVIPVNKK